MCPVIFSRAISRTALFAFLITFLLNQDVQAQYGISEAEQRRARNEAIDNRFFWTELDSTIVSNEFELFAPIPFDYASLKPAQEGMLIFILLVSPNGKVLDYGVQNRPAGIKDLTPFTSKLSRIRLTTPEGRNPFTPEYAQQVGRNFYYFLFWPVYRRLPFGRPITDPEEARWFNYFVLKTDKGISDYYRLVTDVIPPQPLKLNAWKNTVGFPEYGFSQELSGKVDFEVLVDTNGRVIKHRLFPHVHAVYVYSIMQRLYDLRFTPAMLDKRRVIGISRFTFSFMVR